MAEETKLGIAKIPVRATLDELDKDLTAARQKMERAAGVMQSALGAGTKLALGAAIGGVTVAAGALTGLAVASRSVGMEFDEAYDIIATETGAMGDRLEGLKADFKGVFGDIPTDAATAAGVIASLNQRLDLTGKAGREAAEAVLEASRLMGGDAVRNTELLTRVMGDWSIEGTDAALTMDKIFAASQATGIGMDSLMTKIVQYGSPMRLMGFEVEDAIALFAKWEKEGVNAELAMGSLRIAAGYFARENKPLKEGLEETFKAIQTTTDSSKALALGMEVFGARAGPDMVAAIREGRFAIDDLVEVMDGAAGAIERTAEATDDFPEKLERLKNKAKLALEPLGQAFMDTANLVVDKAMPLMERGVGWIGDQFKSVGEGIGIVAEMIDKGWDDVDTAPLVEKFGLLGQLIVDAVVGMQEGGLPWAMELIGKDLQKAWDESVWPVIEQWPGKFWEWLTNPDTGAIAMATEKLNLLITEFDNWIANHEEDIGGLGEDIGQYIGDAIKDLFGKQGEDGVVEKSVLVLIGNLALTIGRLAGKFNQLGGLIGAHIIQGLMSSFGINLSDPIVNSLIYALSGPFGQIVQLFNLRSQGAFSLPTYGGGAYAEGGIVPGPIGMPQEATVHGGEMILNPRQQRELSSRREFVIRFEGVPSRMDQSGLEAVVRQVMAQDIGEFVLSGW